MSDKADERRLLSAWRSLAAAERHTLLQFAEFLVTRSNAVVATEPPPSLLPLDIPAPPGESAVKALKRLKKTYPMIDADLQLLEQASAILMQRVLGSPDASVVAQLEQLFRERYQRWREEQPRGDSQ
ncbi:MAG: hypothetical protein HQL66_03725 [Magnetococcales bacterium]|nr:hypothetical protein [Magnetococcales bacterium]